MKNIFIVMEYRDWCERYNWGVFSSEEKANQFLKAQGWFGDKDFKIISYEIDKGLC